MGHGLKHMEIWSSKVRAVCWVWLQFDSPNSWIFVMVVRGVRVLALSCYKWTLFRLTNDWYFRLKISRTRSSCWSASTARPSGTNSQWIAPSKFHQTYNITLGPNRFLTMTLSGWRGRSTIWRRQGCGNRSIFHHMWQFSCLTSMGLQISWRKYMYIWGFRVRQHLRPLAP